MNDTFGEFKVTNITGDTIIMKNPDLISIEPQMEITFMKGSINIRG